MQVSDWPHWLMGNKSDAGLMRNTGKHRRATIQIIENVKLTDTNVTTLSILPTLSASAMPCSFFLENGSFFPPESDPLIAAPTCAGVVNRGRLRDPFARRANLQNFKFSDQISHGRVFLLIFRPCCSQAPDTTLPELYSLMYSATFSHVASTAPTSRTDVLSVPFVTHRHCSCASSAGKRSSSRSGSWLPLPGPEDRTLLKGQT